MRSAADCLREAGRVWIQVVEGIRPDQWRTTVPAVPDSEAGRLEAVLRARIVADLALSEELAGLEPEVPEPVEPRRDLPAVAVKAATIAAEAAEAADRAAGDDLVWRRAVAVALAAHEVSVHTGSVNPLTEDLARALYEHTAREPDYWRALGYFGEPVTPVPDQVSWRDRFVMAAGHDPHPLWDR